MDHLNMEFTMYAQQYSGTQHLLDRFWSDCYQHSDKIQTHQAIQNLLKEFRKSLDSSSKTAAAIDMDDPLDAIIYYAEKEGYMEIAQLLSI
jgi:hypothetical protein